jgi:uncharacterized protein (TIGR03546 family)
VDSPRGGPVGGRRLNTLAKLLKVLNSETDPAQIALGASLGFVMGLTPLIGLHNLLVLFLVLVLRANLASFLASLTFFSGIAYVIDPLLGRIGLALLTSTSLAGLWTWLYNTVIGRLEGFNNTITMGSLAFVAVLFVPFFMASTRLVAKYRDHVLAWVRRTKLMRMFQASKFYGVYARVSGWSD